MIKTNNNTNLSAESLELSSIPIGTPFPLWFDGNANSVVTKYHNRFIKLSKDSAYNTGKLTGQEAITDQETTFYTAQISDVESPLNGQSVTLINSTENTTGGVSSQPAFIGAGESANQKLPNRLQGFQLQASSRGDIDAGGALITVYTPGSGTNINLIISDDTNGTPRIDKTNRPDTVTAVYYMRIK